MGKRYRRSHSIAWHSDNRMPRPWGQGAGHAFEQLEERTLLSIGGSWDYGQVSADWFDSAPVQELTAAAAFDFVGPLTSTDFGARSASIAEVDSSERLRDHEPQQQWIVRLSPEATALVADIGDVQALLGSSTGKFRVVRGLGLPGQLLVEAPGTSPAEAEVALGSNPLIAYFGRNGTVSGQAIPDDTDFSQLWGLNNAGQTGGTPDADIDAPEAWDISTGSPGVVVAVIDSGMDYTHPDLYLNTWINQGEIPSALKTTLTDVDSDGLITFCDLNAPANASYVTDSNATGYIDAGDLLADSSWADGNDSDQNGFVDDLLGWNFSGTGSGKDPMDDSRHGTHVAGTIAAAGNDTTGVAGVNWSSSMMTLKFLDENNRGTTDEAILAINYATMMRETHDVNVRVANNSWGYRGSSDESLREAIQAAGGAGILFVAAAGNGDILGHGIDNNEDPYDAFYPASEDLDNIISVAASDDDDRLARFSNYGVTSVDIAAPGVSILSTYPGDNYRSRYGTSMAAPHVSGVAALVWANVPDATVTEVQEAIFLGADSIAELQPKLSTGGRLNAHGALWVDTTAPRATLVSAPHVTGLGVTEVLIEIDYTDNTVVDVSSLDDSDLLVTRLLDSVEISGITLQSKDPDSNGPSCTAVYRLPAPDGTWGTIDDSDYEIALRETEVHDAIHYNYALPTVLGTFNIDTTPGLIRVDSFYDAVDANPGDGVADDGTGHSTLRSAITEANALPGDNVVRVPPGTYLLSIPGQGEDGAATGDLDITDNLTIRGAGADKTIIDAAGLDRVLHVFPGVAVSLTGLTITGGDATASGGGILTAGELTISEVALSDNQAGSGGGISNSGALILLRTTVSGNSATVADGDGGGLGNTGASTIINTSISTNSASDGGGGIHNDSGGTITVTNCTLAYNISSQAAGIHNEAGTVDLYNTIVTGSVSGINDLGYNIIGSDPTLGPLQDNGGTTLTHALLTGSPAIDSGDNSDAPTTDQRGILRPQDADDDGTATVDIGAVERFYGEVHGLLFRDDNPNGIRQAREPGLPGKAVYLDANDNGRLDAGEPAAVTMDDDPLTPLVDEAGTYSFHGVAPGSHRVARVFEPGWEQTFREPRLRVELVSNGWQVVEVEGDSDSQRVSIGGDGRFVAFESVASNLVPGDTNTWRDIFVHDRQTGSTERVSVALDDTQANGHSFDPSISADGRFVAFESGASNLVSGDTNASTDIFVYDRQTGITERASVASDGTQVDGRSYDPSISSDGWYVAFGSGASNLVPADSNARDDVFVYDRQTGITERVSVASNGSQADEGSYNPSIGGDGRHVAFRSSASNLVPGDTNGADIFVYDRQTGSTELVSVASDGTQANDASADPSISADGRYVAFESSASNLVPGDTNASRDIFIHDRQMGTTELVSVTSDGTQANAYSYDPSISSDGQYTAFWSFASNLVPGDPGGGWQVFIHDRQTGSTERVSVASDGTRANSLSYYPSISGDGRYTAFESIASNLVPGDTNASTDVFIHDRQTGITERASVGADRTQADKASAQPSIGGDGRYMAFESDASNLVPGDTNGFQDIFTHDRKTEVTERVSVASDGTQADSLSYSPSISADGRYVAFQSEASNLAPGDTNGNSDVFIHDCQTGITERVSVASDGRQANSDSFDPSINSDGRYVAFQSEASNLVPGDSNGNFDVFVHDRQTGITERVSVASDGTQADNSSHSPLTSADGRYVAFESDASNLVPGDTNGYQDAFIHDRQTGITERVSVASDGSQADYWSEYPSISGDGRYVAFTSYASNLTPGDTNASTDIFIHDRLYGTTERVSVAADGIQANSASIDPSISADGRYVAFKSEASNLVPGDTNSSTDVFIHNRQTGITDRVNVAPDGTQANLDSFDPSISADGRYVAFKSEALNLVSGDTNGWDDVFVAVNLPAWQAATVTANVGAGQSIAAVDLAIRPLPGEIRGRKFYDLDRDGFEDVGEPGLADWTIYLDLNNNGTLEAAEPAILTDSSGEYSFTDLLPFTGYTVAEVPRPYWVQTYPSLLAGGTWTVDIGAGTIATDIDFGNHYRGPGGQGVDVITGILFRDGNANGRQDSDEWGLQNWTVFLDSNDNGALDAGEENTQTDTTGLYSFTGVSPDSYKVRAVIQTDWTQTVPLVNSLSATSLGEGSFDQTKAVATGDFDGDGNLDLAVAHGEYVSLLRNLGSGTFEVWPEQEMRVGSGAGALVADDFNHDGKLDLAAVSFNDSKLSVLLNQGDAQRPFGPVDRTEIGSLPQSITAGQFNDDNGDGRIDSADKLDLAIAHANGYHDVYVNDNQVSILFGSGDGTFQPAGYVAAGNSPVSIIPGQFNDDNSDGRIDQLDALDLAVANFDSADVSILINDRMGSFDVGLSVPAGNGPISLACGDFDGDGDLDLAVADLLDGDVSILRNTNGSFIRLPESLSAGKGPQTLVAADLEGDGDVDLIVTNNTAEHLGILRNLTNPASGEIEFAPLESYGVGDFDGGSAYSAVAGHFDADSTLDLAVAIGETSLRIGSELPNVPQNYVSVLLNDVFEGAHHVTVTGTEPIPPLVFGIRPEVLPNTAPKADPGGPYTVAEGGSATLDASGSHDNEQGTETLAFAWDLDEDGQYDDATGIGPTFSAAGLDGPTTRIVGLRVTDDEGASDDTSVVVMVTNALPEADAGGPYTVAEGSSIGLVATGSTDAGGDALTYAWDLDGDGQYDDSTGIIPTFSAAGLDGPATHTVGLRVTDDDGASNTVTTTVDVANVGPTATITGSPTTSPEASEIVLGGSAIDPATADTVAGFSHSWNVTKDGVAHDSGAGDTFRFTPNDNGSYQVTLIATDKDSGVSNPAAVTIDVVNLPPIILLSGDDTVDEGAGYTLVLGAITDPGDDTVTQWTVNWGDGLSDTYAGGGDQTHVYEDNGTFTVTVDLTDEDGTHAGAGSFDVTVNPSEPVDFQLLEHLSLAGGSLYYRVTTGHDGVFTLQVDVPESPQSARLKLYDGDPVQTVGLTPLAQSALDEDGKQRIDWPTEVGMVYYVEVLGDNTDFDVRLANLLHHDASSSIVTVHGTDGNDTFEFTAAASRDVTVNGVRYHFDDAQVQSVKFDGGNGDDTVILDDSIGDDTLTAEATHAVFSNSDQTPGFTVTVDGFEVLQAYARSGGHDRAFLHDSDGKDKFKSEPAKNYAKMYGGLMYNRVKFYDVIEAFSSGEKDLARLFDTEGNDVFEGQQDVSWLRTDVFDVGVHNFRQVIGYALEGGHDAATLKDSALKDEVHLKGDKSEIFDQQSNGDVYKITARRFDAVHADGSEGEEYDRVKMWETTHDNHVEAADNWARMFAQKSEREMIYDVLAFEFVKVRASTGGNDTAKITGQLDFDLQFDPSWDQ